MIAAIVNAIGIAIGGFTGTVFRGKIKESYVKALMTAMGLCVICIGVQSAVGTENLLCVVVSLALGSIIGELLHIDAFLDGVGDKIKALFAGKKFAEGQFTEGMITAFIMFAIGAMTIMGSIEAGINHNYSILFTKTVMDLVSSLVLSSAMGIGVFFSLVPVFIWEALLILLAGFIAPFLGDAVITEMSAVGGALFIAMGLNMTDVTDRKINVSNLIPVLIIPIIYIPLTEWLGGLF